MMILKLTILLLLRLNAFSAERSKLKEALLGGKPANNQDFYRNQNVIASNDRSSSNHIDDSDNQGSIFGYKSHGNFLLVPGKLASIKSLTINGNVFIFV